MTNDISNLVRALDEVAPPAQWDDIVAAASEPGDSRLLIPTASKRRRPAVLVAAAIVMLVGATATGLALRSDRQVEVTSTPASALLLPGESSGPQQDRVNSLKWAGGVKVIVYLSANASDAQRDALQAAIDEDPAVKSFKYLDQAAAYEEFKKLFENSPEFTSGVDPEILPTSFKLVPEEVSSESVLRIKATYDGARGVMAVVTAPDL